MDQTVEAYALLAREKQLLLQQQEAYITAARKMNWQMKELLQQNFGETLLQNSIHDFAGEVIRQYFDTSDYYITVDQLIDRFLHFSYEDDKDLFTSDEAIRKNLYNAVDNPYQSGYLKNLTETMENSQKKLFTESRATDRLDREGKRQYRDDRVTADGTIKDELTGRDGSVSQVMVNGKLRNKSNLHADHTQSRNGAVYNSQFIREDKLEELKKFYNSSDNMQMMSATANTSKGDIAICIIDGEVRDINARDIEKLRKSGHKVKDITYKAAPEELAQAIIKRWEKKTPSGEKLKKLQEEGYLDENGKVLPDVRKKLESNIRKSQNTESRTILKNADYAEVSRYAAEESIKSVKKILMGQIIYYAFPPVIFEAQKIIRKEDMTVERFLHELKSAQKRVTKYVTSKLGKIFSNTANSTLNKFVKCIFDIVIEMAKATVKKLLRIVKRVVMSLIQCVRVISNPEMSAAEKGNAVVKVLSTTVGAVVLEILFEYIEKQFGLPNVIMEPLQIIVTILATNAIMLVLDKADIFNTRYGFIISNMERIFKENNEAYLLESNQLMEEAQGEMEQLRKDLQNEIREIQDSLSGMNPYEMDITPNLDRINKIFDMNIDFDYEWYEFIQEGGR